MPPPPPQTHKALPLLAHPPPSACAGWCSFFTVDAARNFTLRGSGTLEGGGKRGQHWSTLHIRSTTGVQLGQGLRIHCTNSWWCSVMHNASSVHVSNLFIDGKTGRDGLDLVNSRDILIESSRIEGSDDGLCFVSTRSFRFSTAPLAIRCLCGAA